MRKKLKLANLFMKNSTNNYFYAFLMHFNAFFNISGKFTFKMNVRYTNAIICLF